MSNSQDNSHFEELAALHAVGLIDEPTTGELIQAAHSDKEVSRLVREFKDTAALIAHEAAQSSPPPKLKDDILRALPASSKILSFPQWIPYAIAACLMLLGVWQIRQIIDLKTRLLATTTDADHLRHSNALLGLQLAMLEAKDPAYNASKVAVAWDPYEHRGVISLQDLPMPPAGHDYQLWVLDPNALTPISAGLITGTRPFHTDPITTQTPGFAISLEPSGGSSTPTGPILFAVSPGP